MILYTVCPGSSDLLYLVSYYIKWVTTSWTYSITQDGTKYAHMVAKHLGTNHSELYVSERDALNIIPNLPHIYDEPFADSSQIPAFLVSKFAKQKVTVALSGDAGDELFGGYNRYVYGGKMFDKVVKAPIFIKKLIYR